MCNENLDRQVLNGVEGERRPFVERAMLDMSFTPPVVSSFDLDELTMGSASALTPNAVPGAPDADLTLSTR